ncbi:response regulator transcription factor [Promicromonospora sp. MEB111]|uniref:response regulator transcription factor n=1 Tax=Promicromonospora sp. MEB111 TaxID=3040301 RepID=UPI00254AAF4D|nr:response regulator transcription factor [Promicromonospora sp. MEB111]
MDDDALVRQHIRGILTDHGLEIVAEAEDGDEVLPAIVRHRPDVVLMDLGMQRVGGVEAIRRVRALPGGPPCVALTTFEDAVMIKRALEAGAAGYLVKHDAPEAWVSYLHDVLAGGGALSPTAAKRLIDDYSSSGSSGADKAAEARATLETLTAAERDVIANIAGRTNAEIGVDLFISEHTVKSHVSHALAKLGLRRRTELAALAELAGISIPPQP